MFFNGACPNIERVRGLMQLKTTESPKNCFYICDNRHVNIYIFFKYSFINCMRFMYLNFETISKEPNDHLKLSWFFFFFFVFGKMRFIVFNYMYFMKITLLTSTIWCYILYYLFIYIYMASK